MPSYQKSIKKWGILSSNRHERKKSRQCQCATLVLTHRHKPLCIVFYTLFLSPSANKRNNCQKKTQNKAHTPSNPQHIFSHRRTRQPSQHLLKEREKSQPPNLVSLTHFPQRTHLLLLIASFSFSLSWKSRSLLLVFTPHTAPEWVSGTMALRWPYWKWLSPATMPLPKSSRSSSLKQQKKKTNQWSQCFMTFWVWSLLLIPLLFWAQKEDLIPGLLTPLLLHLADPPAVAVGPSPPPLIWVPVSHSSFPRKTLPFCSSKIMTHVFVFKFC